ncbi:hypothetical protein CHS0354_032508 [Potamilus streckersoni]|uniref:Galectin n=1 Tax=Potamilus streckersoni TaxID=2493646 RepID=A0AAE0VZ29_9BIVA|nr:hypothetical protein CHS0354_032508 [Potamilus streckersoni]
MSHHLGVPFVKNVSLKDNGKIVIKGKALAGASRFNIWLQKGAASEPENIVFVYDARFNFGSDKNLIVCNHRKGGSWGSEERNANSFPFVVGEKFKMKIKISHDQYQIQVGSHVTTFHHRMPIHDVDTLRIDGNVELFEVKAK